MERRFCTSCGAERGPAAAFCQACGAPLGQATAPVGAPPAPVRPDGDPVVLTGGEEARCENCGRVTEPGRDRCEECGPAPAAALTHTGQHAGPYAVQHTGPYAAPFTPSAYVGGATALGTSGPGGPPPLSPTPHPTVSAPVAARTGSGRSPRVLLAGAGAALLVLVLLTSLVVGGSGHTLTGSVTVSDDDAYGCDLPLGYGDMREGARVIVTDEHDEVIASSTLDAGDGSLSCEFPFTVEDVPDRDEYWVEVSHRGELHYDKSDLEDMDWELSLSLGD